MSLEVPCASFRNAGKFPLCGFSPNLRGVTGLGRRATIGRVAFYPLFQAVRFSPKPLLLCRFGPVFFCVFCPNAPFLYAINLR